MTQVENPFRNKDTCDQHGCPNFGKEQIGTQTRTEHGTAIFCSCCGSFLRTITNKN